MSSAPQPIPDDLREDGQFTVVLKKQLVELEKWADANKKDALRDQLAFWSLKIPAILAAASAGVWAHFELTTVSVIAGSISSLCVIIDGIHPRGMLRNVHLRAYHDITNLITKMVFEWRYRTEIANDNDIARQIIRDNEEERRKIAIYIRDAETALQHKTEN
jgi:hypothetical protein